jgi:AraC-like DNA-binding protein
VLLRRPDSTSPLHGRVDVLWYFDLPPAANSARFERVLPTGTVEFVFNLGGDEIQLFRHDDLRCPLKLTGSIACGPHTCYFALRGEREGRVAGVHFKPGGAHAWLAQPVSRIANSHANLQDLLATDTGALRRELAALDGPAVLARLEDFLVAGMRDDVKPSAAVVSLLEALHTDPYGNPLPAVRRRFGLTAKGLGDACKREVGLTPKKFARVLRFQEVLKRVESGTPVNWADIAHRCGYYDQAHFTRDFRSFCGFSPRQYLARVRDNKHHVPD